MGEDRQQEKVLGSSGRAGPCALGPRLQVLSLRAQSPSSRSPRVTLSAAHEPGVRLLLRLRQVPGPPLVLRPFRAPCTHHTAATSPSQGQGASRGGFLFLFNLLFFTGDFVEQKAWAGSSEFP